ALRQGPGAAPGHQPRARAVRAPTAGARLMGVVGILVLLAIAFALSNDRRRAVNPRILGWGLGLQFAMALFALRTRAGVRLFTWANDLADAFVGFADAGIRFVFGDWPATAVVHTPLAAGAIGLRPVT